MWARFVLGKRFYFDGIEKVPAIHRRFPALRLQSLERIGAVRLELHRCQGLNV
jgi:hypothetical protein